MIKITHAVSQLIHNNCSNISWLILKFLNNFPFLIYINFLINLIKIPLNFS